MEDRVARGFVTFAGLGAFGFALLTFFVPDAFAYYGLTLETPEARILVRTLIGGFELALAGLVLLGGKLGLDLHQRAAVFGVTLLSLGGVRILAGGLEGFDVLFGQPIREAAAELLLGAIGWGVARRA